MTRSIDNFLTAEEIQLISDFISWKEREASIYVLGKIPEAATEQNERYIKKIKDLRQTKYNQWKARVDNISYDPTQTWHTKIRNGEIECPINDFLISFKKVIESDTPLYEEHNLLQKLEQALCGFGCPCPAD